MREANVFSLFTLRGGYPYGGYPDGRVPWVPTNQTWMGGTLMGGTPGNPLGVKLEGGTPGTPPPPIRPGWGGYPDQGGTPLRLTDGGLDKRRSVCLLRSRRRTFLFIHLLGHLLPFTTNKILPVNVSQTERLSRMRNLQLYYYFSKLILTFSLAA